MKTGNPHVSPIERNKLLHFPSDVLCILPLPPSPPMHPLITKHFHVISCAWLPVCTCSCTYLRMYEQTNGESFSTFSTPQTFQSLFCILLIITRKTTLLTVFCYFRTCSAALRRTNQEEEKYYLKFFTENLCRWKTAESLGNFSSRLKLQV